MLQNCETQLWTVCEDFQRLVLLMDIALNHLETSHFSRVQDKAKFIPSVTVLCNSLTLIIVFS